MTTHTAPRGLCLLVCVHWAWAKTRRISGQGHPHVKPALKVFVAEYCLYPVLALEARCF
ncbi:hypothetical protein PDIG_23770 [Penicillium digitatum PHI26]|uniref:Secreted protein n=2 Tax=Penicillium digitatum TaxID=36651 RepID=K9G516_PEND2|nr:hypothetical protein PDIP_16180 [Penicillium digitatum Pd1]EKV16022.1 hypothetical protein PDIG_23770 [Penicillium digitatum PHI26]EKV20534.1 hypothetical protein PDIP_16180 [Penicillium digitatum Pd1]